MAAFSVSLLFGMACWAGESSAPQKIDLTSLVDQFGHPFRAQDSMAVVMLVNGMKVKNMVRDALAELDVSCLQRGRVIYLANISGMPKMISKFMAVPRMRELNYPVWLDYTGSVVQTFPARKGEVTLLTVDSERAISAVDYVASGEELRAKLMPECGELDPEQGS